MVERRETEVQKVSEEVPVCPECSRRFKEQDMTWLEYNPILYCNTDAKFLYPQSSGKVGRTKYDSYESALDIWTDWKYGVCDFCAVEKFEMESVNPRSLDEALSDSGEPLPDGGVVNDYETVHETEDVPVTKVYCNRCSKECESEQLLYKGVNWEFHKSRAGSFGKSYVNSNWHSQHSPDWSSVVSMEQDEKIHVCESCFKEMQPKLSFRLKRRVKRLSAMHF